jgi:hypothetical protein
MNDNDTANKRATIYFEPALHQAIRLKAAHTQRSMSDIVNDAVRMVLREDQADLASFDERALESELSYEAMLKEMKTHGRL